ncbi:hypothetical protein CIK80_04685 [Psychrobacter sp. JB193]|nr:hypothetical protein CIK80_04685 [Psychrobacter sp. JB193]
MTSPLVFRMAEGNLQTEFGKLKVTIYNDGQVEATVLQTLELNNTRPVHLRIQSTCITGHYFNSTECSCKEDSDSFQNYISANGNGLLILLNQEGRANGNVAHISSQKLKEDGATQDEAYLRLGFPKDSRDYSIVAKILANLGIKQCLLHSENERKLSTLQKHGISCITFKGK